MRDTDAFGNLRREISINNEKSLYQPTDETGLGGTMIGVGLVKLGSSSGGTMASLEVSKQASQRPIVGIGRSISGNRRCLAAGG
jgi:hypothetical protein